MRRLRPADRMIGRRLAALALSLGLLFAGAPPALAHITELAVFGDSLAAGHGLPQTAGFPAQLEARLRADGIEIHVIDAGFSGDTTTGGLARLDWTLAQNPDFVILELGGNDLLRGIDPKVTRANLDAMIVKIQRAGAKILLAGMRAPPNWGAEYQREFDRIYPELAQAHGVTLYPFFLDGVAMNPELNQPDGLHPNERGVAAMVERIAPVVVRFIGGKS